MIPKECKRLIEVDFPIAEVSKQSAREKSIRHGHPSTLHLWWARRPLAACRSVLLGLIFPDPCDPNCPEEFKSKARKALSGLPVAIGKDDIGLRQSLLDFIATFSDWDRSSESIWLEASRKLVKAAYPEETPLVVDPFAGGGSIPLEALRVGCDSFASDLNPVACLIMKSLLEDIPRHSSELADELRRFGSEIKAKVEKELANFYPADPDGAIPIVYLWARTVRCESPNCGAEIPLMRSLWLCKKAKSKRALQTKIVRHQGKLPRVEFKIFEPVSDEDVAAGTVTRSKATCPCCGTVLPPKRVRTQLTTQKGGADTIFDKQGKRVGGARMTAVVTLRPGKRGRHYRLTTDVDYEAVRKAHERLEEILAEWECRGRHGLCPTPSELMNTQSTTTVAGRGYGITRWEELFTARQKTAQFLISRAIELMEVRSSERQLLSLALSRRADISNALCPWSSKAAQVVHLFGRQAIPMAWDFGESSSFGGQAGDYEVSLGSIARVVERQSVVSMAGQVQLADATDHPLPDQAADLWFTDPPYYDAIAYADLSDFFLVWLKRTLPKHPLLHDTFDSINQLSPKTREIVQDRTKEIDGRVKDRVFFEDAMSKAFTEGYRVLREDGIGAVVFAHKTTEGWEALLSGMIGGGWTITGSWPIATERPGRLMSHNSAALSTSVHLVCRPRPEYALVGEWEDILRQLPKRMRKWVIRLDKEGIHGADLVFSCIGPALELFSKYRKVETAEGEEVKLGPNVDANGEAAKRGYLSYIWEVVGRTALELVLSGDGDEGIGTLEEDARLCALFLWTHQSTETKNDKKINGDVPKMSGLSLPFDIVRRFAQPLGIHLPDWEDRVIKTEKGVVKLIPVVKRAKQLFGVDITSAANQFELQAQEDPQMELSLALETAEAPEIGRRHRRGTIAGEGFGKANTATTLDRVHAAMLLQAGGKTNALRALLRQEIGRGSEFLRLANSLSALYPQGLEEKRLLDAMLLAAPR